METTLSFDGARVLVTGANRGIGEATARLFSALGADIVAHYNKDAARAEEVTREIRERAPTVTAIAIGEDLSSWDAGERLVARAEEALGGLDVVVVNHGIWKRAPIDTMSREQYEETMDANLRGAFSVCGAAAKRMKGRKNGSIVLIASTAAQRGEAFHSHYAASKGAIVSMTKSLAAELAPFGIRVNCVAPGWVETGMTRETLDDPETGEIIRRTIPLARVGEPEEIAWPIAFIASARASFMTGEILNVNGGAVLVG